MVALHLVRHGRTAQNPALPSWEWSLAEDAREGVDRLRSSRALPKDALWVTSTEPKAVATAALLTDDEVRLDDALREAERDPVWLERGEFERLVLLSFVEPGRSVRAGWEPLSQTRARVMTAAKCAIDQASGRDVVLVGHGTAWTMLVAGLTDAPPDVAGWESMLTPDHCALECSGALEWSGASEWPGALEGTGRITAPWGSWSA